MTALSAEQRLFVATSFRPVFSPLSSHLPSAHFAPVHRPRDSTRLPDFCSTGWALFARDHQAPVQWCVALAHCRPAHLPAPPPLRLAFGIRRLPFVICPFAVCNQKVDFFLVCSRPPHRVAWRPVVWEESTCSRVRCRLLSRARAGIHVLQPLSTSRSRPPMPPLMPSSAAGSHHG